MQKIWVQSIVVPEVVLIILAGPMPLNHEEHHTGKTESDVGPEDGTDHVEPGVNWSHDLVVWMVTEASIAHNIWESLLESYESMLHQGK